MKKLVRVLTMVLYTVAVLLFVAELFGQATFCMSVVCADTLLNTDE